MAKDIWICENQKVTRWDGDILAYKNHLKAKVMRESNKDAKSKPFFVLNFWTDNHEIFAAKGLDKGVRGAW